MTDPLSISAAISGIITFADVVYGHGSRFRRGCKDCPREIKQLVLEIYNLKGVFEALEPLTDDAANAGHHIMNSLGFSSCREDLTAAATILNEFQSKPSIFSNLRTTGTWPLKREEIMELVRRIERHKNTINMAAIADNIHIAMSLLEHMKEMSRKISDMRDDGIVRRREELVTHRQKALEWLSPYQHDKRHYEISRNVEENTGQWFLNAPSFIKWLTEEDSPILWCRGIPGSGKSYLTSIVIEYIQNSGILSISNRKAALAYVYFDYNDRERQTPENILAELLKQLEFQLPDPPNVIPPIYPHIQELYDISLKHGKRPSLTDLEYWLTSIGTKFDQVYLVFDALDECDEQTQRSFLLRFIMNLPLKRKGTKGFKILITARPHCRDIELALQHRALEMVITAHNKDIELAVRAKIEVAKQTTDKVSTQLEEEIVSAVLKKAAGMFLLANIHADYILQQTTVNEIRQALEVIPKNLNSTYKRAMKAIEDQPEAAQELALRALRWIVNAKRPLQWVELQIALAIKNGQSELDANDFVESHKVIERCAGLVVLDHQTHAIRLVHYSAQEYLLSVPRIQDKAHLSIANTCINYFLQRDFDNGPCLTQASFNSRLEEKQFLNYCGRYWGYHCRLAEESGGLVEKAIELMSDANRFYVAFQVFYAPDDGWIQFYGYNCVPASLHSIHGASVLGLRDVVARLLDNGKSLVRARDSNGMTALHMAAKAGHDATVQVLLQNGADIEAKSLSGDTALHLAAQAGHEAIVLRLLKNGSNIETVCDHDGNRPLHRAAMSGHDSAVQLLLEYRADIEAHSKHSDKFANRLRMPFVHSWPDQGDSTVIRDNGTALNLAAGNGHVSTVQLLLGNGARIEATSDGGETALHQAAGNGHTSTVRLLLGERADIKATTDAGETALHKAAQAGHEKTVCLLLQNYADIDSQTKRGKTALHLAAKGRGSCTIRQLLKNGANIEATSRSGKTALHVASAEGQDCTVSLLLDHSADFRMTNASGETALHLAAQNGFHTTVWLLLEAGSHIEAKDTSGATALHLAASSRGKTDRLLIWKGTNIEIKNSGRETVYLAASPGPQATVALLISRGANIEAKKSNYDTALFLSVAQGVEATVRLLLEKGADKESKCSDGQTALHRAVSVSYEMVQLLLDDGAHVDAKRDDGQTPLHLAVCSWAHRKLLVPLFLEHRANINAKCSKGETPLHKAVRDCYNDTSIVELLLKHGADVHAESNDGQTPLRII